jgi:hypothetical protein
MSKKGHVRRSGWFWTVFLSGKGEIPRAIRLWRTYKCYLEIMFNFFVYCPFYRLYITGAQRFLSFLERDVTVCIEE